MPRNSLLVWFPNPARALLCLLLLALPIPGKPALAEAVLPAIYGPVFTALGVAPQAASTEMRNGITRAIHLGAEGRLKLMVDRTSCAPVQCLGIMRAGADHLNSMASRNGGRFMAVTETELQAEWRAGEARVSSLVQMFPATMLVWTLTDSRPEADPLEPFLDAARRAANQERAEQLAEVPEDALAPWVGALHAHARALLAQGKREGALALLRRLARAVPTDLAVLTDLAENEATAEAARAAAQAVVDRAEDTALRARATAVLEMSVPPPDALPVVGQDGDGLRLVLIALPPCDVGLLADAARVYERITDIPTRVARLDGDWAAGPEDRFLGQPLVLEQLRKTRRLGGDAEGWDRARMISALRAPPAGMDAMGRYTLESMAAGVAAAPAQYNALPLLTRLGERIAGARSADPRVMYVGVTEAAIYTPGTVFAFSAVSPAPKPLGILSYAMMLGRAVEGGVPSRPRLVERMAKEMVPASLAQLGIPRPADPTDPYSEANSVARLAEKTLTLSAATRAAVEAARAGVLPSR